MLPGHVACLSFKPFSSTASITITLIRLYEAVLHRDWLHHYGLLGAITWLRSPIGCLLGGALVQHKSKRPGKKVDSIIVTMWMPVPSLHELLFFLPARCNSNATGVS